MENESKSVAFNFVLPGTGNAIDERQKIQTNCFASSNSFWDLFILFEILFVWFD